VLQIVLNNLVSNAVKYSSIDNEVIVIVSLHDEYLCISVKDYGIGIPDNEQNHIFELFYRAKNTNEIGGTGIGLAVVQESMIKLGGRIELNSKLGYGSEFKVYLPI